MNILLGTVLAFAATCLRPDIPLVGIKDYALYIGENEAIVAVIPEVFAGYDEKKAMLSREASVFAKALGKNVVLTEDALCFAAIRRIDKRHRPRDVTYLEERINAIRPQCFCGTP